MAYFGQIATAVLVTTALIGVGDKAYDVYKTGKMARRFRKKLTRHAANIDYMKNVVNFFRISGNRLAVLSGIEPGTQKFEFALMKMLRTDMNYKGNCNVDVYAPIEGTSMPNTAIWASVTRSGYVGGSVSSGDGVTKATTVDVGPIWATGCKNAQSEFRINYLRSFKATRRFETKKIFEEKVATADLISKFVIGSLLIMMLATTIKIQLAK